MVKKKYHIFPSYTREIALTTTHGTNSKVYIYVSAAVLNCYILLANVITLKGQTDRFAALLRGLSQTKAMLLQDGFFSFIELFQQLYMRRSLPVEQISTSLDTADKTTRTNDISHRDLFLSAWEQLTACNVSALMFQHNCKYIFVLRICRRESDMHFIQHKRSLHA